MNRVRTRRAVVRSLAAILAGTLIALLSVAPAAHAATRGPSGTISGGFNGWQSRPWYNYHDGYDAYIWMAFCSSNPRIEVWRYKGGPRDEFVVGEIQYCLRTTDYFYFGDLSEGTYYFKIADKRSDQPFGASYAVYH
ncbi:hypothetical protein ILP97_18310 [Amycolatopsis sp. H6(2020)]|nr:hypothetical protein [Amycolatopsis sp. H6(2020)]